MIRAGLRRVLVIVVVVLATTAAIAAGLGALAGKSVVHALALGYYLVGVGVLLGSLAFGLRGPNRVDRSTEEYRPGPLGVLGGGVPVGGRVSRRRTVRTAKPEERREARLASVGLFVFGVALILLGAILDPTRRAF